ncbi:MAG: hypothetical protein LBK76_03800, partial [Verrucomicrobiales bacterium]|nr:hypothetical protein [Verrucomicrobiales bacterium]
MNPKLTFLTLCALSVSALNVLAQNLVVTSDTTVSGTHYENNSTTYAALTNSGTWTFTGSDVTLTGTADSGNGGYGVRNTGGGTVNLIDGVIEANAGGVLQSNTSAAVLRNVNITTQSGPGVTMSTSSTATISGGTITTNSGGNGVTLTTQSGVTLRDVTVNAFNQGVGLSGTSTAELHDVNITAANSHAVALSTSSTVVMVGGTIVTTSTGAHHGVNAGTQSSVSLENVVIISANGRGISLTGTSTAVLDNVNITTNNSEAITAIGIAINTGTLTARDVTLTTSGSNSAGMTIVRASFYGEDLTINTTGAMARGFRFEVGSTGTINGLQITTQGDYAHGFTVNGDNIDTLTVLHINDAQVQTSGYSAHGVTIGGDLESELYMENSTITASGEGSNGIYFSTTGTSVETVTLTNVTVTAQNSGISVGTSKITDTPSNYENLIDRTGTYAVLLHSSTISGGAHLININTVLSGTNEAGEIVLVDNPVALTTAAENSTLIGDT